MFRRISFLSLCLALSAPGGYAATWCACMGFFSETSCGCDKNEGVSADDPEFCCRAGVIVPPAAPRSADGPRLDLPVSALAFDVAPALAELAAPALRIRARTVAERAPPPRRLRPLLL